MTPRRVLTPWMAIAMMALPVTATSQTPPAPAVTILAFETVGRTGVSQEEREELADGVAVRLVESHRFRVLDRTLLPGRGTRGSLASLRGVAADAGVEYVVMGTVRRTVRIGRARLSIRAQVIDVQTGAVVIAPLVEVDAPARARPPRITRFPGARRGAPMKGALAVLAAHAIAARVERPLERAARELSEGLLSWFGGGFQ